MRLLRPQFLALLSLLLVSTLLVSARSDASLSASSLSWPPKKAAKLSSVFSLRGGESKTKTLSANLKIQEPTSTGDGTASIPNEIFNLVKGIVGAGVLGLPAGVAAFGNHPDALWPFCFLVLTIGSLSGYGFSLIGRVCAYTQTNSYREAWNACVSSETSWLPTLCCLLIPCGAVTAYSMILADTLPQLVQAIGTSFSLTRTQALLGITTFVLLPLCLLKELKKLAPFSLLGILGMCYTSIAMLIRYLDGSYVGEGRFLEDLSKKPSFGDKGLTSVFHPNAFILISMLSTAAMAHYNAPKFFYELQNNTIARYNTVVSASYGISLMLFIAVGCLGFLTFGEASSGLVLNNYSTRDTMMSFSRVAVAFSIIFSYPLAFVGVRDGVLDLARVPSSERTPSMLNTLTVVILTLVTALAYVIKDLTIILAIGGATWGNAVTYLFPTYMMLQCVKEMPQLKKEKLALKTTGFLGLTMGVIGTYKAIESIASSK